MGRVGEDTEGSHPRCPSLRSAEAHTPKTHAAEFHRGAAAPRLASLRLPRKVLVSHTLSPLPPHRTEPVTVV